eukprot:5579479-Prymnesium_polylepis.3
MPVRAPVARCARDSRRPCGVDPDTDVLLVGRVCVLKREGLYRTALLRATWYTHRMGTPPPPVGGKHVHSRLSTWNLECRKVFCFFLDACC